MNVRDRDEKITHAAVIYTTILFKSVVLSQLSNCRSQFLLDRLGKCLKLFVSTESTSSDEFASQLGLEFFVFAKNINNYILLY